MKHSTWKPLALSLAVSSSLTACVATDEPLEVGESEHEIDLVAFSPPSLGVGDLAPVTPDIGLMAQNIRDDLQGNVVGYAFAIAQNGKLVKTGASGLAKRAVDGASYMTSTRRLQVASVTKNIEAIAVLKLLDENGLSIDSPVAPWLPDAWSLGAGWTGSGGITFRHLLTHTSGLKAVFNGLSDADQAAWGNDWDGLEYVVSLGTTPTSGSAYKNANFALFRVIIPALWKATGDNPDIGAINQASYAVWHLAYMQQHIFEPAGVQAAACMEQAAYPGAYAYDVNDSDESGHAAEVSMDGCGGHAGYHLSARDILRVAAYAAHDDSYFAPELRQLMDENRLGWSSLSNTSSNGRAGKYWHGGDWNISGGRRINTCVMKYPFGIEATLVLNSDNLGGKYQCTVLKDAYNDSF